MTSRAFEATWPEELPRESHCSFFYTHINQLRWAMVSFFLKGLRKGAACTFYTSRTRVKQVYAWLKEAGVPVHDVIASGQLCGYSSLWDTAPASVDELKEVFTRLYMPRLERYPMLYHVGDPLHLESPPVLPRLLIELECRVNQELAGLAIKALCAYDLPLLDGQTLLHLLQTHPFHLTEESVQRNPYVPPDRFLKRFRQTA